MQIESGDQKSVRGAQLLLAGTILQQYCTAGEKEDDKGDDGVDVIDVSLRPLTHLAVVSFTIFSLKHQATVNGVTRLVLIRILDKDKKKERKSIVTEEPKPQDGGEPPPIDLLVDTIIGFLERGTAFLRTVANQSFSLLSAHVERSTIELILTVGEIPSHDAVFGLNGRHSSWNEGIPLRRPKVRTKAWRMKKT